MTTIQKALRDALARDGIKLKSLEECAKAELHLCSDKPFGLKGEQQAACSECGRTIFFTQSFPPEGPQPRKVCIPCALTLGRGEKSFGA